MARPTEHEVDGFLGSVWIVVGTATTGIVLFRPRADLVAVTLLTAYWAWSGLRALRIRHVGPVAQDALVSVCALAASVLLALYLQTVRMPWAPAVVHSTLGTLVVVSLYDLARFAFPTRWFETLWPYEHLVKNDRRAQLGDHGVLGHGAVGVAALQSTRSVDALGGCHDRVCRSYPAARSLESACRVRRCSRVRVSVVRPCKRRHGASGR